MWKAALVNRLFYIKLEYLDRVDFPVNGSKLCKRKKGWGRRLHSLSHLLLLSHPHSPFALIPYFLILVQKIKNAKTLRQLIKNRLMREFSSLPSALSVTYSHVLSVPEHISRSAHVGHKLTVSYLLMFAVHVFHFLVPVPQHHSLCSHCAEVYTVHTVLPLQPAWRLMWGGWAQTQTVCCKNSDVSALDLCHQH